MSASSKDRKDTWQDGEVIWFDKYSGEGEIRAADGIDYFVHYSAILSKEKWKALKAKRAIKFKPTLDPNRNHVAKIKEI